MSKKPDMKAWVKQYAIARYGSDNAVAQEAWELLRQGVLNYGADAIQGPVEDVWGARPNLDAWPASTWGVTINKAGGTYTKERRQMLIDAMYKLLSQSEALNLPKGSIYESNYNYDLVEFGGAVMADYAYDLLLAIRDVKNVSGTNDAWYKSRIDAFLALIEDVDAFKGTNLNFRLGKWTQEARDAAAEVKGATSATADWYELVNSRTLITTWGDESQNRGLKDYSYRSWQGLLRDYYLPRWKYYFDHDCTNPASYFFFEWNWAHAMQHHVGQTTKSTVKLSEGEPGYRYSRLPEGNTVVEAQRLLTKYIIPVHFGEATYYAYRNTDNHIPRAYSISVSSGAAIDLSKYFGSLTNAVVTSEIFVEPTGNLASVRIKPNVVPGQYTATLTLGDASRINFLLQCK
jgi:hypothetical protein